MTEPIPPDEFALCTRVMSEKEQLALKMIADFSAELFDKTGYVLDLALHLERLTGIRIPRE